MRWSSSVIRVRVSSLAPGPACYLPAGPFLLLRKFHFELDQALQFIKPSVCLWLQPEEWLGPINQFQDHALAIGRQLRLGRRLDRVRMHPVVAGLDHMRTPDQQLVEIAQHPRRVKRLHAGGRPGCWRSSGRFSHAGRYRATKASFGSCASRSGVQGMGLCGLPRKKCVGSPGATGRASTCVRAALVSPAALQRNSAIESR